MSALNHITLSELQQRIKSAVEESLALPVWVVAEIAEMKVNYSGHCYMELVEKAEAKTADAEQPRGAASSGLAMAQARAVIWRSQSAMLAAYL